MVRTSSTMLPLGTPLPKFDLAAVSGLSLEDHSAGKSIERLSSNMLLEKPLLLMVICAHCPFVKHVEMGITNLQNDYEKTIQFVAISSNSLITHPQDGPKLLRDQATQQGWRFPYLLDEDQTFAKALKAACTPDFFIFTPSLKGEKVLKYRGQMDGSRPGNTEPITGQDLRSAIDQILQGKSVSSDQKPSIGCNIKWHPGQEPNWFG